MTASLEVQHSLLSRAYGVVEREDPGSTKLTVDIKEIVQPGWGDELAERPPALAQINVQNVEDSPHKQVGREETTEYAEEQPPVFRAQERPRSQRRMPSMPDWYPFSDASKPQRIPIILDFRRLAGT